MSVLKPRYLQNADASATFAGSWLGPFRGKSDYGFQCSWATGVTGTISVEVTEDGPATVQGGGETGSSGTNPATQPSNRLGPVTLNASAYVLSGAQPAGTAGSLYINIPNLAAPWLRLKFTASGGSAGLVNAGASGGTR